MGLAEAMQKLYVMEVNCSVSSFWDGGFVVRIGDEMNGFKDEKTFEAADLGSAGDWLMETAARFYGMPEKKL